MDLAGKHRKSLMFLHSGGVLGPVPKPLRMSRKLRFCSICPVWLRYAIEPATPVCRPRHGRFARRDGLDRAGIAMTNWLPFRVALVASLAVSLLALAPPAHAEKRVALVIGNNDYKNVPKLQKAVNDARAMGDTLKKLGFSVMVAENQNRQQFSQTLLALHNAVGPAG